MLMPGPDRGRQGNLRPSPGQSCDARAVHLATHRLSACWPATIAGQRPRATRGPLALGAPHGYHKGISQATLGRHARTRGRGAPNAQALQARFNTGQAEGAAPTRILKRSTKRPRTVSSQQVSLEERPQRRLTQGAKSCGDLLCGHSHLPSAFQALGRRNMVLARSGTTWVLWRGRRGTPMRPQVRANIARGSSLLFFKARKRFVGPESDGVVARPRKHHNDKGIGNADTHPAKVPRASQQSIGRAS